MNMDEFVANTGKAGDAFLNMCQVSQTEHALDEKTFQLVYIGYLTAIKQYDGLEIHTKILKDLGATWDEVQSAILCGLPCLGVSLLEAYEIAKNAYESK